MMIKLEPGESAYKKVREIIEGSGIVIDEIMVRMYLSNDSVHWFQVTPMLTSMSNGSHWSYDWWDWEKYIMLIGFMPACKILDSVFGVNKNDN